MHDHAAMRIRHGVANIEEQPQPLCNVELVIGAIGCDRRTVDVFHDNVGDTAFEFAKIEHARDMRVLEQREHLTFQAESSQRMFIELLGADQLYRDLLFHAAIGAMREKHAAHATSTEFALDQEGTYPLADPGALRQWPCLTQRRPGRHVGQACIGFEQGAQVAARSLANRRVVLQTLQASCMRQLGQLVEQGLHTLKFVGVHLLIPVQRGLRQACRQATRARSASRAPPSHARFPRLRRSLPWSGPKKT